MRAKTWPRVQAKPAESGRGGERQSHPKGLKPPVT